MHTIKGQSTKTQILATLLRKLRGCRLVRYCQVARGIPPEAEIRERRAAKAGTSFLTDHPEFIPCEENWMPFVWYFKARGIDPNRASRAQLEDAFKFASGEGMLELNSEAQPTPQPVQNQSALTGLVQPVQKPGKPFSSGLPDRGPSVQSIEPKNIESIANQVMSLPIDEVRRFLMAHMLKARNGQ